MGNQMQQQDVPEVSGCWWVVEAQMMSTCSRSCVRASQDPPRTKDVMGTTGKPWHRALRAASWLNDVFSVC